MPKTLVLIATLLLASSATCIDIDDLCDFSYGFGEGFATKACASSMNSSCYLIYSAGDAVGNFMTTWELTHLSMVWQYAKEAVSNIFDRFSTCRYTDYMVDFIPHIYRFFVNYTTNTQRIQSDTLCIIHMIFMEDYYQAGICAGHIWKIVLGI